MTISIEQAKAHHATKAKAERLMAAFEADYPMLALEIHEGEQINEDQWEIAAFVAVFHDPNGDYEETRVVLIESAKVPDLADVLDATIEQEIDIDEFQPEEEESKASGSIVKDTYRLQYKANSSNGQTCGDWLAEWLTNETFDHVTGFNVDDFQAVLDHNNVPQDAPWARLKDSDQKGWRGRWRMNGRQALEKAVALAGEIYTTTGARQDVPEDALAALQGKHQKWLDKQHKLQAAAEATAGKGEGE